MQSTTLSHEPEIAMTGISATTATPVPSYRTAPPVRLKLFCMALVCGGVLWMCHFPLAWGWLGWLALVPLMPLLCADIRNRWRYLFAWLAGTLYFWPAISWMTVADTRMIACWAMLSFYCSLYFPVAIFLVRRLERTPLPLVLTFPAAWTALEFFRSFFGTGFSWYLLGHTQHNALAVIQIADLGGAFAVSFLVAAVNVIVYLFLVQIAAVRQWLGMTPSQTLQPRPVLALQCGFVALLLGGTLYYGLTQMSHDEFETGPRIAVLQGNLDQRLRIAAHRSPEARAKVEAAYIDLCMQAAMLQPRPQLIVWPETSFPGNWITLAPNVNLNTQPPSFREALAKRQEMVRTIGASAKTNVLLGLNTEALDFNNKIHRFNSALLVDGDGIDLERYDKIHRVPFGEYVPFREWLPLMNEFSPYDFDYSISCGGGLTRFHFGKYRFGVLICYEDTDPFMAREYGVKTSDGPPVDFLINISNDGWFDGSSEHEHLAVSRFRAIECRRALARSVNMGISAVIDSNGRVLAPVKQQVPSAGSHEVWNVSKNDGLGQGDWHEYKKTEGILVVDMPIDRRESFYAAHGDLLPNGCWALIGTGLAWGWWRRRKTN